MLAAKQENESSCMDKTKKWKTLTARRCWSDEENLEAFLIHLQWEKKAFASRVFASLAQGKKIEDI